MFWSLERFATQAILVPVRARPVRRAECMSTFSGQVHAFMRLAPTGPAAPRSALKLLAGDPGFEGRRLAADEGEAPSVKPGLRSERRPLEEACEQGDGPESRPCSSSEEDSLDPAGGNSKLRRLRRMSSGR